MTHWQQLRPAGQAANSFGPPSRNGRRLLSVLALAAAFIVAVCAPQLLADDGITLNSKGDFVLSGDVSGSATGSTFTPPPEPDIGVGGMGIIGRIGHQTGPTVGQNQSLTYFDMNPYVFFEETYLFGDGRLFIVNDGHMGGSAGMGIRHFFPNVNSVGGLAFYYDRDDSRGVTFEQFSIAGEVFTEFVDWRTNVYIPFGRKQNILGVNVVRGSEMFVPAPGAGSNIQFQRSTMLATALRGFESNWTVPIPGELPQQTNMELTAGFYNYQAQIEGSRQTWGWQLRGDVDLFDRLLHVFLLFTSDNTFDNNIIVGGDVNYWHGLESRPRLGGNQFNRIAQYVRRNRTVVAAESSFLNAPELAINPATGQPFLVYHVRNLIDEATQTVLPPPATFPAPAGNGSLETPFQFISEAQNAVPDADIIYVHADSVFDGDIVGAESQVVMEEGDLILGEGVNQVIPVVGIPGGITLPRATAGTNPPILRDIPGTGVVMANNSTFAGFQIQNFTGNGILVDTVSNVVVRDVTINGTNPLTGANNGGPTSHGVFLTGVNGPVTMSNVDILNTIGNAVFIQNSNPTLTFTGSISNGSGFSLLIDNSAGVANFLGTTITDNGGQGILINNASTAITLDTTTLNDITGDAFSVVDFTGGMSVQGDLLIDNPAGDGILISALGPDATVSFPGAVTVNSRNGVGINLMDDEGRVLFLGDVSIGTPAVATVATSAVNSQNNAGDISFNNLSINGGAGSGINIGNGGVSTGRFTVNGFTSIANIGGSSISMINDQPAVEFNGVNIDNRGGIGIEILQFSGPVFFNGQTTINNQGSSILSAIDIQQSTSDMIFGTVNVDNAFGNTAAPNPGVFIANNHGVAPDTAIISFAALNVNSNGTTAVRMEDNDAVSSTGGTLDAVTGTAIEVVDNIFYDLVFNSISASNSDFGILVTNTLDPDTSFDDAGTGTSVSTRRFVVTGVNGVPGTGGTIMNMTVAGARFDHTETDTDTFLGEASGFVRLFGQIYDANVVGVQMRSIAEAELSAVLVQNSNGIGVDLLNVPTLLVEDSQFISNGAVANTPQFRALAGSINAAQNVYNYDFNDNAFSDGGGAAIGQDLILLSTTAGGTGSTMNLLFRNHGIPGSVPGINANRALASALHVQWAGVLRATIENNNIILLQGSDQTGVEIETTQTGALADVVYRNNVLSATGADAIGFEGDFSGPTALDIVSNFALDNTGAPTIPGFQFGGFNSRGIDLSLRAPNNVVTIDDNIITFNAPDGVGIQFTTIAGPSITRINGNTINLFNDIFQPFERGIFFQTVIGNITLQGNRDNVVTFGNGNFTIPFFIPAGVSNGSILVNGTPVP